MPALVTQPAPEFKGTAVINGDFKDISLADYKGKYLVLFFYPLDFTFVCPTEILAFNDRVDDFRKMNAELVACSVDSKFSHRAWWDTPRAQGGIKDVKMPLLADLTKKIAADYGVLLDAGIALRGLFIIDTKGIVRHITINDLPLGRNVDEALRLIQAIDFADKNGEVCPANWTPGAATIKPTIKDSKKYFETVK